MQAHACGLEPSVAFNPVLLKPGSDRSSQVVVLGRADGTVSARVVPAAQGRAARGRHRDAGRAASALRRGGLRGRRLARRDQPARHRHRQHGPGAGRRPAGGRGRRHRPWRRVRRTCSARVAVLAPADQARIAGFVINKFRGDPALLAPGLDQLRRAHRAPDARRRAVGRRAVARRRGLARPRSPTGCWAGRAAARGAVAAGGGRPAAADLQRHRRRGAGLRAGRRGPVRDRAVPARRRRPGRAARVQGDGRRPGVAAPHRAGRTRSSRTRRPGVRCSASAAATRCSGGGSRTRTGWRAGRRDGLGLLDLDVEFAADKAPGQPDRHGVGRAGARLRDPPRPGGALGRRRCSSGRSRAPTPAPSSARTGTGCWRTTGSAARCCAGSRSRRAAPGSGPRPDTSFAAERAAQLDLLGDLVEEHLDTAALRACDRSRSARRSCRR